MRPFILLLFLPLLSCNTLPKKTYGIFDWAPEVSYAADSSFVEIRLSNPVNCPLRIGATATKDSAGLAGQLREVFPLILPPLLRDTTLRLRRSSGAGKSLPKWSVQYAHSADSIRTDSFLLPYPPGREHRIMQGYNGSYSHNNAGARYALDFALAVGDTVCAAADGYVVGLIKGYKKGGNSSKWMRYANFINLYHPDKNVYTQYVHLRHNGSLVDLGDHVAAGQPIGISGMTGWTSKPHLHFNVVRWEDGKRISLPATFGRKTLTPGTKLRKGTRWRRAAD